MIMKAHEVRSVIPSATKRRSTAVALMLFVMAWSLYIVSYAIALRSGSFAVAFASAMLNGVGIGMLFVIGHDACHMSFTRHDWLNHFIGRLAFLPSLFPFASWELGHNRLHHCWTNLRSRDYVWVPHSVAEYEAMSFPRKWLERVFRHPLGLGLYSVVVIWGRHMMWPDRNELAKMKRCLCRGDRLLVLAWLAAQLVVCWHWRSGQSMMGALLVAIIVPLALFHALFGAATYLHHTHPRTRWFDDAGEWSFFSGQVKNTVHVILPRIVNTALLHIMEHTAHHIDQSVPLYRLPDAQRAVSDHFSDSIITVRFSIPELWRVCEACQLYDYDKQSWLSFDGTPTTEPMKQAASASNDLTTP